ncbi:unnamed protein product, partial [Adineta steineri]
TVRSHSNYPNNNHRHYNSDLVQYGSPTLSSSSSAREQQSITINFSTSTPEASSHGLNGYSTEQSPRLTIHSPAINRYAPTTPPPPPPPPLLSQFEPTNHMSQHLIMKQTVTRPSASPPPPPLPPPPPPPPV